MKVIERVTGWLTGRRRSDEVAPQKAAGVAGIRKAKPRFAAIVPSWLHRQPAAWSDDPAEQVRHYRHWVFAAAQAVAFQVAGTRLALYARTRRGTEEIADHPFLDLMERVNPFHTRFWLWAETVTFMELTGNAYWYIAENGLGAPAEIWLAHSQYMRVAPDRREFVQGYVYSRHGEEVRFRRNEIIHLKYPNPANPYYGRGPLQAAAESVDAHESMKRAEWNGFRQGIFPGLALESDHELSEEAIERLRTAIELKYASPDQAGRPLILESGLRAKPVSLSPREMDFLRSERLTRDEILAIFRVPAAVLGLTENVNRAVAEAMDLIFARYCIAPKLRLIEAQLNQDLLPRFDARLFCRFEGVIPEDREQTRADMEANLRHGVTTINEERRRQGRAPVAWGDKPNLRSAAFDCAQAKDCRMQSAE
jgi:HK97 family phage portal protein